MENRTALQIEELRVTVLPDGRMTAANASRYLGISEKTLAGFRCNGKGPKYIKRGKIFYRREDLDSWVKEGETTSTGAAQVKKHQR